MFTGGGAVRQHTSAASGFTIPGSSTFAAALATIGLLPNQHAILCRLYGPADPDAG
ncbi:hypothetical protein [Prescottella subtropica]|uniref:hypothetical protein n=1 Tax=Prescottella subtropica TaxID=2545757 RepID=UPI0013873451|nr:hypothetical protein [Prescottella subtropica]